MHGIAAHHRTAIAVLFGASTLAACAGSGSSPAADAADDLDVGVAIVIAHTSAGLALAGPTGKTLYVTSRDRDGTSTCTADPCARAWGALVGEASELQVAAGVTGTFGITIWADGTQQVTHNGQPLYYYSKDEAAGDARGHGGGNGAWCIASVSANPGCPGLVPAGTKPMATFLIPPPAQRAADSAEDY